MPITRSTWVDDDGSGTTGTVLNNAELQKIYNNIDAALVPVGVRVDVPFGGLFAPEAGVWTVDAADQVTYSYTVVGKLLTVNLALWPTELSSASTAVLRVYLHGGFVIAKEAMGSLAYLGSAAPAGTGVMWAIPGLNYLRLMRDLNGTPWPVGASYYHAGSFSFFVQ